MRRRDGVRRVLQGVHVQVQRAPEVAQAIYCILIGLSAIASIILRSANLTIDFGASVGTDGIDRA